MYVCMYVCMHACLSVYQSISIYRGPRPMLSDERPSPKLALRQGRGKGNIES